MSEQVKDNPPYLDYPKPRKKQTNADKIRAMNDEQLAELFTDTFDDENIFYCPVRYQHRCLSMDCKVCFLDWLKQEVSE